MIKNWPVTSGEREKMKERRFATEAQRHRDWRKQRTRELTQGAEVGHRGLGDEGASC